MRFEKGGGFKEDNRRQVPYLLLTLVSCIWVKLGFSCLFFHCSTFRNRRCEGYDCGDEIASFLDRHCGVIEAAVGSVPASYKCRLVYFVPGSGLFNERRLNGDSHWARLDTVAERSDYVCTFRRSLI